MSSPRERLEPILPLPHSLALLLLVLERHRISRGPRPSSIPQPPHMVRRDNMVPQTTEHEDGQLGGELGDLIGRGPALGAQEGDVAEDGPAFDDVGDGGEGVLNDERGDLGVRFVRFRFLRGCKTTGDSERLPCLCWHMRCGSLLLLLEIDRMRSDVKR